MNSCVWCNPTPDPSFEPSVGYQAHNHDGHEEPGITINSLIQAVRPTGRIGVVGVFVPEDPNASTELAKAAEGYKNFDDRLDGWTKVVLHP